MENKPEKTIEEIEKYLQENDIYADDISEIRLGKYITNAIYDITLEGDWKHTHLYLSHLMEQIGYMQTQDNLIYVEEYDGSDYYRSTHRFVYYPYYMMFNK